jgi:hypothetical protein
MVNASATIPFMLVFRLVLMLVLPFALREMSLPQNDFQACAALVVATELKADSSQCAGALRAD